MDNAREVGAYLQQCLEQIADRSAHIGVVRGRGLMIGCEFVKDKATREADHDGSEEVMIEAFRRGLLLLTCGKSTIRFCPPLVLTKAEVDEGLTIFEETLQAVYGK
jgi:4-aminobutyrate aminotransferase